MLENVIYLSPLITLILGMIRLLFMKKTSGGDMHIFTNCRLFVAISFLLVIIFYNKPMIEGLTSANKFIFAFQMILYIGCFILLYLAGKYYKGMQVSGYLFYQAIILALLAGQIIIISHNLMLTMCGCALMTAANYLLLHNTLNRKEITENYYVYIALSLLCFCFFAGAVWWLRKNCPSLDYAAISSFFAIYKDNFVIFVIAAIMVVYFIFLLGYAPLHFGMSETLGNAALPVFMYFMCVYPCACWAAFIKLQLNVLPPMVDYFEVFYIGAGISSLIIGALGACSSKNIRKLFSYSNIFCGGIILMLLQDCTMDNMLTAVLYLFIYILSMCGICINLFSVKIKGDYLSVLQEFSGLAHKKPYSAVMFIILLFSLLGFPPFIGFIGNLSVMNNFVAQGHYWQLLTVVLSVSFLAYAYLQILHTFYAEKAKNTFDRVDSGIYVLMSAILLGMTALMVNPQFLVQNINIMLEALSG